MLRTTICFKTWRSHGNYIAVYRFRDGTNALTLQMQQRLMDIWGQGSKAGRCINGGLRGQFKGLFIRGT